MTFADDAREVLAGLSGPLYAAADRPRALGGWVSDAAGTAAITLRQEGHPGDAGTVLDVETWRPGTAHAEPDVVAARTLRDAVANATRGGSPDVTIAVCARLVAAGDVRLERVGPAALRRSLGAQAPGP